MPSRWFCYKNTSIAQPDFQWACQNMSIQTDTPIAMNDMVAGNNDDRWLPNTTTLRRASLQPIREVLTLGENTLHPSVPEAGGSKFIRKFWQIPIRIHGSKYQKIGDFLFAAPTQIQISHDRILQINPLCENKQRHLRVSALSSTF